MSTMWWGSSIIWNQLGILAIFHKLNLWEGKITTVSVAFTSARILALDPKKPPLEDWIYTLKKLWNVSRKSSFLLFSSVATPKQFLEQLIGCSVEVASLALAFWMKPPFGYNSHHLILNLTALLQHGLYLPTPVQHPDCSCSPPPPTIHPADCTLL